MVDSDWLYLPVSIVQLLVKEVHQGLLIHLELGLLFQFLLDIRKLDRLCCLLKEFPNSGPGPLMESLELPPWLVLAKASSAGLP